VKRLYAVGERDPPAEAGRGHASARRRHAEPGRHHSPPQLRDPRAHADRGALLDQDDVARAVECHPAPPQGARAGVQGEVGSLRSLSERLWTPPTDERLETYSDLASDAGAAAVTTLLSAHHERVDPWSAERLAALDREQEAGWRWEATAVLVTGALALGTADLADLGPLLDTLVHVAFARDELTLLARRAMLIGVLEPWPPPVPGGGDWRDLGVGCLMDIRSAGSRLAAGVSAGRRAEAVIVLTDADGITSLSPSSGTSRDQVAIFGTFPARPRTVLFLLAGGGTMPAEVTSWSTGRIDVLAPEPVGDGPVGFVTSSDAGQGIDPDAAVHFADVLASCLGASLMPVAGRLSGVIPHGLGAARRDVGPLPGDVNVFHGGPIVLGVSPASGVEGGPVITVRGRNLVPGDAVAIEGLLAPTRFIDAATLTFTPPAIASGRKILQIRRGYRRSNGTPFDVRASLASGTPSGRVTPGAYAELKGTGFGPGITATVDGRPTTVSVYDTHTLEVQVRRPARPPVDTDRRGEPVTVEVFDLGASLGSVIVTLDTFRIASLGDSVVWGQGLLEPQKFSMLVADTLTARYNGSIAVFATDRCAHSGARIVPSAGDGPDPQAPRLPGDFAGECPSPVPSVTAQVAGWTAGMLAAGQGREIDLVILDGGANDVRITTIMNPSASDPALSAVTTAACSTGDAITATLPTLGL
jgi:IPT/TIG domain